MNDLLVGIGIALVIEGVLYALLPRGLKAAMRRAIDAPEGALRIGGLVAVLAGVTLVWLVRA